MISSYLLGLATACFAIAYATHRDYRASGTPGGKLSPDSALLLRNAMLVLGTALAAVGASLKTGGF